MFLPHLILLATNIFICHPKGENRDKSISEPSGECKMRQATASAKAHCFRRLSYFPGPLLLLHFHIFKLAIFSFSFWSLSPNIFMKIGGKFNSIGKYEWAQTMKFRIKILWLEKKLSEELPLNCHKLLGSQEWKPFSIPSLSLCWCGFGCLRTFNAFIFFQ